MIQLMSNRRGGEMALRAISVKARYYLLIYNSAKRKRFMTEVSGLSLRGL